MNFATIIAPTSVNPAPINTASPSASVNAVLAAVDRAVAGGYVAVVHASLLLPMILLGQLFLWTQHVSLRRLSRAGRSEPEQESVEVSTEGLPVERGEPG